MDLTRWARPAGLTLTAGIALYGIALAQSDPAAVAMAAERIGMAGAVLGGAICLAAIALRFLRWQLQLGCLGQTPSVAASLRIYWAGIALTWTPGKLGETLRSVLLRPHGVAVPDSLAAFLADRLSDVIGVALLGLVAAAVAGKQTEMFVAIVLLCLIASLAASQLVASGRVPVRWRLAAPLHRWALLWSPLRVLLWVAIAGLAYGLQALVFAAFARALAPDIGWAACVAAFAAATFVGAASLVPAGLGAMEATLAFALTALGLDWSQAVAVTLLTRLCTLWIPSGLGVLALLSLLRRTPLAMPASPA